MNQDNTKKLLIRHVKKYPDLEIRDIFKFLYQSALGCEHLVSSAEFAINYIKKEYETVSVHGGETSEPLDGRYSRVNLSCINAGLHAETLGKLFCLSAKKEENGICELENKLNAAEKLVKEGALPFSCGEFESAREEWRNSGYSALHHSEAFRNAYHPAYRVISNEFVKYLPLMQRLDKMLDEGSVKLAIEGGSASGKTTLSSLLEKLYGCTVFHMDDFFLRSEQRTPERFSEPGGNVDRERFLEEVLIPMSENKDVTYRKFDCSTFTLTPPLSVAATRLTVIEGVYSMHPDLSPYYDLSAFINVTPEIQRERILKRNSPQMAERFFEEWIPLEKNYFDKLNIREKCDVQLNA